MSLTAETEEKKEPERMKWENRRNEMYIQCYKCTYLVSPMTSQYSPYTPQRDVHNHTTLCLYTYIYGNAKKKKEKNNSTIGIYRMGLNKIKHYD